MAEFDAPRYHKLGSRFLGECNENPFIAEGIPESGSSSLGRERQD